MNDHLYRSENWQLRFRQYLSVAIIKAGSKSKLAREIGVDYSTILSWFRGAIPQDKNIRKIERYAARWQRGT
ncbi:MAG: helix-turn-helix domain-containing protein [Deltaproteobacteria bacterium]|nr:helix-turn-helix domain-containing protein [Deltaproteobacteria bacterium]